ncbi:MAG: NADH:ubiquinone oxidoreductase subunit N, partial [Rhodoferax sp.]|nr:NADH:ubiquinone oxidoreductase subunit N [Rhodoferax sp.]
MIDKLSLLTVYPELILLVMACVIALFDLAVKGTGRTPTYILTLVALGVVAWIQAKYAATGDTVYAFGNMVVSDPMGNWL